MRVDGIAAKNMSENTDELVRRMLNSSRVKVLCAETSGRVMKVATCSVQSPRRLHCRLPSSNEVRQVVVGTEIIGSIVLKLRRSDKMSSCTFGHAKNSLLQHTHA